MKSLLQCAVMLVALSSAAYAGPVDDILAQAKADCASFESGEFAANDAVIDVDLDGLGESDKVVDSGKFSCSSAVSLYCGTGGCVIHAVIGDKSWSFQAEDWRMTDWDGRPILLIARDGGWCGGAGAQICYEAVVWSHGDMLTVMPYQE